MIYILGCIFMIIVDQISKIVVVNTIKNVETVPIINNVFHLTYCENSGAAFSIFSSNTFMLTLVSLIFIAVVGFFIFKALKTKCNKLTVISLLMVFSGAVGNLIDRVRLGYVIDFFDFRLINFAIFNVADILITVGGLIFCIMLFLSDDDLF